MAFHRSQQYFYSLTLIHFAALKIQCSESTADLLHTLGGYVLVCRGTLNVKVMLL